LLRERTYSLQANRKRLSGKAHPDREAQFGHIEAQIQAFLERGWPIISVDAKKRELIGPFRNAGRLWCQTPPDVNTYDFPSLAEGVAIPYGIYDPTHNRGYVFVGTSRNTAELAVDAVAWWWSIYGQRLFPNAPALLTLADGGGSNGYRNRLWKYSLQHKIANVTRLAVTVSHYPTGASKWNPIEHRLFGPISTNWAGEPLISHAKTLNLIRGTTTQQGLVVHARLSRKKYRTGIKVPDDQMEALYLHPDDFLPAWNYTIKRLWCINPKGSYNRRNDFLLRLMVRKPGSYQAFPNGSCY